MTSVCFADEYDIKKAELAYRSSDYETAQLIFRHLAELGQAESQRYLGEMYDKGLGLRRNYKLAIYWYRKAAEQGYASAQYRLGVKYANGHGVKKDNKVAYAWFVVAYDSGHEKAANSIRVLNQTMSYSERQQSLEEAYKLREKFGAALKKSSPKNPAKKINTTYNPTNNFPLLDIKTSLYITF